MCQIDQHFEGILEGFWEDFRFLEIKKRLRALELGDFLKI